MGTKTGFFSSLVVSWVQVYWLALDYLAVATAALRLGAYFTSLLYVEHWLEELGGGLTLEHTGNVKVA
jgi:hypothetical protein